MTAFDFGLFGPMPRLRLATCAGFRDDVIAKVR